MEEVLAAYFPSHLIFKILKQIAGPVIQYSLNIFAISVYETIFQLFLYVAGKIMNRMYAVQSSEKLEDSAEVSKQCVLQIFNTFYILITPITVNESHHFLQK